MNGRTSRLLKKAAQRARVPQPKKLRRWWYQLSQAERARYRKDPESIVRLWSP